MRVISGEYKGRKIATVSNKLTRPTSDKVKESLFNMIGPYFNGGYVLDLFAGSGALGLEALSRGMNHVIFVDRERQAVQIIKKNLITLNLLDRAEVYRNDAFRALKAIGKRNVVLDYIFIDPPYKKGLYEQLLEEISEQQITNMNTTIICEHDASQSLPDVIAHFRKIRTETYGHSITISLYKRKDDNHE